MIYTYIHTSIHTDINNKRPRLACLSGPFSCQDLPHGYVVRHVYAIISIIIIIIIIIISVTRLHVQKRARCKHTANLYTMF